MFCSLQCQFLRRVLCVLFLACLLHYKRRQASQHRSNAFGGVNKTKLGDEPQVETSAESIENPNLSEWRDRLRGRHFWKGL